MNGGVRAKKVLVIGAMSLLVLAFELALLLNAEPLPPAGPLATILDRGIERARVGDAGAPAVSVAIVCGGALAYTHVSGLADVATSTAVTTKTRFRVGSITKMFTALTIMQLVAAGRIDLDATVATYLPDAPHASEITIRELLAHRSGLPNFLDMAISTGLVVKPTTPDAILAPLITRALDFTPNARFDYSNTNYVVLARIIERLESRPLAAIERERIFVPAGMTDTSFESDASVATGYEDARGTKPAPTFDASWLYGSADLITTPTDLARFDIALIGGKLVPLQTLALMTTALEHTGDGVSDYGLGMMTYPLGMRTIAGHHGALPGYTGDDEMIVGANFAVIVLGNSSALTTSTIDNVATATLLPADFAFAEMRALTTRRQASSKIVTPLPPSSALP